MLLHAPRGSDGSRFRPLNRLLATDRWIAVALVWLVFVLLCARAPEAATPTVDPAVDPHIDRAATPVAVLHIEGRDGYEVARRYAGTVVHRRSSALGFGEAGALGTLAVDEGDAVTKGQELARLDDARLRAAERRAAAGVELAAAALRVAQADLALAERTAERIADLRRRGHASDQEHDDARLARDAATARLAVAEAEARAANADLAFARERLADARIVAPFDGVVARRLADEGARVTAGAPVLELVETSTPEVRVALPRAEARRLADDDAPGAFQLQDGADAWTARFDHVLPTLDSATRTATALFTLTAADPPPAGTLVELLLDHREPVPGFWLPIAALTEAQRGLWAVLAVGDDGVAERHLVELLHTVGDRVYVRGTLPEGTAVVSTGVHRIVPGERVRIARVDEAPGAVAPTLAGR
jgi:RND family efflux transporter MFP subunit